MNSDGGSRARVVLAGFCAAGFAIALVALVTAQLALMSVLDATRAERAAEQIAESRFTADLIEQTVVRAVAPIAGAEIAGEVAVTTSSDPRVIAVVRTSLVNAHRQIVDPGAPADVIDGNLAVGSAIAQSVIDTADRSGLDLTSLGLGDLGTDIAALDPTAIARQAGLPDVVPTDLPRLGLRQVAETTRVVALIALLVLGVLAVLVHPRPGRSLRGVGVRTAIVCGAWLVAMLVAGWLIGLVSATLFGEMLDAVWSDAVPSMLLVTAAGAVIGLGIVFGGMALDGYRAQRHPPPQR
ncbi:MAG: hypothetical protein WBP59_13120 [Ilumatobacteraceae bacterium]